jgi:hypothetical protein
MKDNMGQEGGVYFIFHPLKHFTKVTAIDVITKTEISISAPHALAKEQMQELAIQRLAYVLRKKNERM